MKRVRSIYTPQKTASTHAKDDCSVLVLFVVVVPDAFLHVLPLPKGKAPLQRRSQNNNCHSL